MYSVERGESGAEFGDLLQYYRQQTYDPERGGYLTQARLAEFANCGFSGTTLGHWETGERTIGHLDRFTLCSLIDVLHGYGGLQSLDEANRLLEAGLYRRLTREEIQAINEDWLEEQAGGSNQTAAPTSPVTLTLSQGALYETLDAVFRWSEADEHARSSWAGMFVWSLSVVTKQKTAHSWFTFLSFMLLWAMTSWLMMPILRWPIDDRALGLRAVVYFAVASVAIPFIVAIITSPDVPPQDQQQTIGEKLALVLLKVTGAVVGFNTVALVLLFAAIGLSPLGTQDLLWVWQFLVWVPLLMAYVGARRIPADRHKMYKGDLRLHSADPLFLTTFLLIGAAGGAFVYVSLNALSGEATGLVFLIILTGLALWRRHQESPVPDPLLILSLGMVGPISILYLYFFAFPSAQTAQIVNSTGAAEIALASWYVVSTTTTIVTVLLRNPPSITLGGAVVLLSALLILLALLRFDVLWGRMATLLFMALWLVWGRTRFRDHFWIHPSVGILLLAVGFSILLAVRGVVPVWANIIGYTAIAIALISWVYHSGREDNGPQLEHESAPHLDKP